MHRFIAKYGRLASAIVLLILVLGVCQSAAAQATLRHLAIGVSQTPKLPAASQLRFAHKDAIDLDRLWHRQAGKLCPKTEGVRLIDQQATRSAIVAALDRMIADSQRGDIAMIALCGHAGCCGVRGEWGFLPYDYDGADSANTALTATTLRSRLTALAERGVTVVLILDCCHAGAFGAASADFVVFAACLPQEFSHESADWNNGLFTMALIEALEGRADFNGDGVVTIAEVDAYVTSRVAKVLQDRAASGGQMDPQNPSCGRPTSIRSSLPMARIAPATATQGRKLLEGR